MTQSDARARIVLALRQAGVTDSRVLEAIETIPREVFMSAGFENRAWEDAALPIECGQTISQPYVVGVMTAALSLSGREKVLEIGTGSGYQTAILAKLSRRVFTLERYRTLLRLAQSRHEALKLTNIVSKCADGGQGWPDQGPFDRIIFTCATPFRPDALLAQLAPGGILVAPVGAGAVQELLRYRLRDDGVFEEEALMDVRFVPLLPGVARDA
ncbi:protein-L-isoaspartate O-methyltransferase [Candidatus Phycosocius bacilliformis]|uniref:Protein-L-isoaspartate O-methyltransferase n=1 Tax=Candidatus Phycosocius bacilliformis TaxID=1445552 RepID=A0A2P2EC38_9PROT|nr:protein-L-isoaspartate(D-aspartate) O-methyltransferase [Candidatus Phycosocius bacilliformis]GBF58637.1 protein-L-isoaspartate O-methyltransferase [Candidatus Phycosocius bacilliformis]